MSYGGPEAHWSYQHYGSHSHILSIGMQLFPISPYVLQPIETSNTSFGYDATMTWEMGSGQTSPLAVL